MEKEINEQQELQKKKLKELQEKTKKETYELMFDDEYTSEKYSKAVEESQKEKGKLYSNFTDDEINSYLNVVISGYASFGKEFINKLLEKSDHKQVLIEAIIQEVLDLNKAVDDFTNNLRAAQQNLANKKKEEN